MDILSAVSLYNLQVISCFMMAGVIWVVQLVHYPTFLFVSQDKFKSFEIFHSRRISWIVIPLMITELMSAFFICFLFGFYSMYGLSLLSVVLVWLSTALLSVPCHMKLNNGFDEKNIKLLIYTNWPRTIIWTLRSFAFAYIMLQY